MSDSSSEELKSPLIEFCEKKLEEFEDLEDDVKLEATTHVRELCGRLPLDNFEGYTSIPPSKTSDPSPTSDVCNIADLEDNERAFNYGRNAVLEILTSPEGECERSRKFSNCIDNFVQQQKSTSMTEESKRRRLFIMLTSAKEFLTRKLRGMFNKGEVASQQGDACGSGDSTTESKEMEIPSGTPIGTPIVTPSGTPAESPVEPPSGTPAESPIEPPSKSSSVGGFEADDEVSTTSSVPSQQGDAGGSGDSTTESKEMKTLSKSSSGDGFEADDEVSNTS